jgi:hypothetical protein
VITSKSQVQEANAVAQYIRNNLVVLHQMAATIRPILQMVHLLLAMHQINQLLLGLRYHQA